MTSTIAVNLPAAPVGWFDVSYAICADGTLARIQASVDVRAAFRARQERAMAGVLEPGETQRPVFPLETLARIVVFDGEAEATACQFTLEAGHPRFDRLPDGRWVVADSRCPRGALNARLIEANGSVVRRFCLGDGIMHLQCDNAGNVWVGYFDEGVFGNFGWGGPDGPEPIGAPGLVKFSPDGEVRWAHDTREAVALGYSIDDCGALNVRDGEVWCCFYGDHAGGEATYPVLRIAGDDETVWRTPLWLVDAIAVEGDVITGISNAPNEPYWVTSVRLGDSSASKIAEVELAAFGILPGHPDAIMGRGSRLHVVKDGRWLSLTAEDVAGAALRT